VKELKVAVGLSGGVDSSVAAAMLKRQGHEVIGIHMTLWGGKSETGNGRHACYGPGEAEETDQAASVAEKLQIPFHTFDLSQEYEALVLSYFRTEYLAGRTPNPCLMCNPRVKFGALVDKAANTGLKFDYFATGHYARVHYDEARKRHLLMKAMDPKKDQSYGLVFLSQKQLARTMLPLGEMTKSDVRKAAKDIGLQTHDIPDSQDFYSGDYSELVSAVPMPGEILDTAGNVLGKHKGAWHFTIGQRRHLGISTRHLFVKEIDAARNVVIVGKREDIFCSELIAGNLNLIAVEEIADSMDVGIKFRHSPKEVRGTISPVDGGMIHVKFKEPQWGLPPGQVVAFYDKDMVIGGGTIEKLV
jgi:tRNA-specific 2-thiouridylase